MRVNWQSAYDIQLSKDVFSMHTILRQVYCKMDMESIVFSGPKRARSNKKIKLGNGEEKSKSRRESVNSIYQALY
nr:hypothetical protein [Tanacetum cinerariifolium]